MGVLATTYGAAVAAIKGLIGKANGIAGLGSDGKVPSAQLPSLGGGGTSQDATSLAITAADEGSPAGNTRGDNAVDLQSERANAAEAATGDNSTIAGGQANAASALHSTVGGGSGNTAQAAGATVAGGADNTASGNRASVGGGGDNTAQGPFSTVPGGQHGKATLHGEMAHAVEAFSADGDVQRSVLQWLARTTDATQTEMTLNNGSLRASLLANEYFSGRLTVFAVEESTGDYARWTFEDVTARRVASASPTVDVGGGGGEASGVSPDQWGGTGETLTVDVNAYALLDALRVQVTGNASEDWRWHAIFDGHRGLYGS